MTLHLDDDRFGSFLAGAMTPSERRETLVHLLRGCRECGDLAARQARLLPDREDDLHPRPRLAMERILGVVREREFKLAMERAAAPALLAEVRPHPPARRLTLVRNSRRFQRWGFCEIMVQQSFEEVFNDTREAVSLAEVAVAAADALDQQEYGEALVEDMRGRARVYHANALRVVSDLSGSSETFRAAAQHLSRGTGDPIERGHLLYFESVLRYTERRLDDAHRLLDRAIALFEGVGDDHLVGRAILQKGRLLERGGNPDEAIRADRRALQLLDRNRDPRLVQIAEHSLVVDLNEAGRHEEALALLVKLRATYRGSHDRILLLRLTWTEGKIELARGRLAEAGSAFVKVRSAFIEEGIPIEVALASLDLAIVYHHQRRTTEMKQLAAEMLAIFCSLRIQREAIAALLTFQKAVEMEAVTLGLIAELAAYLERSRRNPDLRFEHRQS
jgi:tetratricopeptide (TPR) repeat protein